MTPAELAARLDRLIPMLENRLKEEVLLVAQAGKAMVETRITETGTDAGGSPFKPYTRAYELRKRGAVGTAKKEGKKKRAARREAEASADKPVGRYRGFVDFQLSGQMWNSIGVIDQSESGNRVKVRVGGVDDETRLKMQGNDEHRPGWLRLSEDEVRSLAAASQQRLAAWAEKFLA